MPSGQSVPLGLRSAQPERLPNAGTEKILFRLAAHLAFRVNRRARGLPIVIAAVGLESSRSFPSRYAGF